METLPIQLLFLLKKKKYIITQSVTRYKIQQVEQSATIVTKCGSTQVIKI